MRVARRRVALRSGRHEPAGPKSAALLDARLFLEVGNDAPIFFQCHRLGGAVRHTRFLTEFADFLTLLDGEVCSRLLLCHRNSPFGANFRPARIVPGPLRISTSSGVNGIPAQPASVNGRQTFAVQYASELEPVLYIGSIWRVHAVAAQQRATGHHHQRSFIVKKQIAAFTSDESGATSIEYALIAAGIGLAIITAVNALGTVLSSRFDAIKNSLR